MILVMNLTESIFLIQNDTIFLVFATSIIMFSLYAPVTSANLAPARTSFAGRGITSLQVS
jgi:exopolysaccharide production protein ExoQ